MFNLCNDNTKPVFLINFVNQTSRLESFGSLDAQVYENNHARAWQQCKYLFVNKINFFIHFNSRLTNWMYI